MIRGVLYMRVRDRVYGEFEIEEDVLVSLIKSDAIQRLKGIAQFGLPDEFYHFQGFTRYEHSIGVMLLLRSLRADLKEQIAGLLHDVSHTAFSHVVDWTIGDREREEFHDENHDEFIYRTEIPEIISNYGFDTERLINEDKFPLLERDIPELCADRVDYTLRELKIRKSPRIIKKVLKDLKAHKGKILFDSKESAKEFGENYLELQDEHWGGSRAILRYHLMSNALKMALDEKIIEMEDLYKTDEHVLEKLKKGGNKEIEITLRRLKGELEYEIDAENPDFSSRKKFRYVDPLYIEDGELKRLSETNKEYRKLLKKIKGKNERRMNIKLLS